MHIAGLSVVIPAFNSEETLNPLVERLEGILPELTDAYELILVNDGSRDGTWERICELASRNNWIRGICLSRNYGQHNALLCGIRAAQYEFLVTLDDDLQNPPEEIPKLLAKLAEGWDVVYGTPEFQQHGLWRNLASRMTKRALQSAVGAANARNVSPFRAFRTQIRNAFKDYHGPFVSIDVLLSWGASRFTAQTVRHDIRRQGLSNYTFRKLVSHAIDMMTGFSVLPLRLASFVGFAATLFGIAILLYVILRYFMAGGSVPGFPFLASIIAIFSGAQLFALGIMGEYLARMHFRAMDRPTYAVSQDTKARAGEAL
jgi:glycosyltransferase involved in cell wall biosynthesis